MKDEEAQWLRDKLERLIEEQARLSREWQRWRDSIYGPEVGPLDPRRGWGVGKGVVAAMFALNTVLSMGAGAWVDDTLFDPDPGPAVSRSVAETGAQRPVRADFGEVAAQLSHIPALYESCKEEIERQVAQTIAEGYAYAGLLEITDVDVSLPQRGYAARFTAVRIDGGGETRDAFEVRCYEGLDGSAVYAFTTPLSGLRADLGVAAR